MLQDSLIKALRTLVSKSAPGDVSRFTKLLLKLPDLRTLNNMHSEKLLSFRIDAWEAFGSCYYKPAESMGVDTGGFNWRLYRFTIAAPPAYAWLWWCSKTLTMITGLKGHTSTKCIRMVTWLYFFPKFLCITSNLNRGTVTNDRDILNS